MPNINRNKNFKLKTFVFTFVVVSISIFVFFKSTAYFNKCNIEILNTNPLSLNSIWDQQYLAYNLNVKKKLEDFESNQLCQILKTIDNKNKTYEELKGILDKAGFSYKKQPLLVDPTPSKAPKFYLKKDGGKTKNPNDPEIVFQEIYFNREGCLLRIKKTGFPGNIRSKPHSTKAVLTNAANDPTYENEAFKVTWNGKAVPKGPQPAFGLRKEAQFIVDCIMGESHPTLTFSKPNQ